MAAKEVLFIHHSISLSDVIQAGFEDISDWNISKANTFRSSLIQILINPPDLIILEFEFPDINGVEILKAIRNYVCCYAPAVVFISKPLTLPTLKRWGFLLHRVTLLKHRFQV